MLAALVSGCLMYVMKGYEVIVVILYLGLLYWIIGKGNRRVLVYLLFSVMLACFYHGFIAVCLGYSWVESVALCITYMLTKWYMPKVNVQVSNIEWGCACVVILISIVMYEMLVFIKVIDPNMNVLLWMLHAIKDGLICYLGYRMMLVMSDYHCLQRDLRNQQEQEKLYIELKEANEINQSFRHDQVNLVNAMHVLLADDQGRAKVLFDECMKKTTTYCSVVSGNATLDWLLSSKQTKMNQKQSIMQVYVNSALHELSDHTLVVIMGNLLDNAMEAQAYVEDPRIIVRTSQSEHHYYIKIRNRYNKEKLREKDEEYYSTKEDGKHHGIGLKNVRASIEELHGIFRITHDDLFFQTFVCIPRTMLKQKELEGE